MSKAMMVPNSSDLKVEWLELDCRVYTGPEEGFTESIHIDEESEPRAGSVTCLGYWHEEGHWGFVFKGGHVCLINNNRIRYIKGSVRGAVESETERDDVVAVQDGGEQGIEQGVHEPIVTPKRRGRPPKVKAE